MPQPAVSDELRQTCRNRLLASLSDLSSQTTVVKTGTFANPGNFGSFSNFLDEKSTRSIGVATDGKFWISKVLKTIDQLEANTKHVTLHTKPSSGARELYAKARETLTRLLEVRIKDSTIPCTK